MVKKKEKFHCDEYQVYFCDLHCLPSMQLIQNTIYFQN